MSRRESYDPLSAQSNIVLVSIATVRRADRRIKSCEACTPAVAEIRFAWLLDPITSCDSAVTDYVLEEPAQCPRCGGAVTEKTLVVVRHDFGRDRELPFMLEDANGVAASPAAAFIAWSFRPFKRIFISLAIVSLLVIQVFILLGTIGLLVFGFHQILLAALSRIQ